MGRKTKRRTTEAGGSLFLCTLPLVNPIVHGDGVGYYAYVRAPLIDHNFRLHTRLSRRECQFSRSARGWVDPATVRLVRHSERPTRLQI